MFTFLLKIAADDTFIFFLFYLWKKIRLDVQCKSYARQRIQEDSHVHMKYQVSFSLKNNEKVLINVVCLKRQSRLQKTTFINIFTLFFRENNT